MHAKEIWPDYANIRKYLQSSIFSDTICVDDSYLQGDTFEECYLNVPNTIQILRSLGVTIHPKKSIFRPKQSVTYLGFVLNSIKITSL